MTEQHHKKEEEVSSTTIWLIAIAAVLILFNQIQLFQLGNIMGTPVFGTLSTSVKTFSRGDLGDVDINSITSTAQAIAATFELEGKDAQGVIDTMIPKGTPPYGAELGISYDDPVTALNFLHRKLYPAIKQDVQKNKPEVWKRYLNLATKPVGISCEYCCGVGPVSIDANGNSRCGCSHNPAIHALTLYLMANTDMTDAEILQEALRWKALWFPKNMIQLGTQIAGGDASVLADVPSMVGGC
ncbi:MAG: hypothetical protein QW165_03355 [Candidatus Woesearchaeota archaeon]